MSERGIKKWAPYKSLKEQDDFLNRISENNKKIDKPLLSSDQAEIINEILVNYQGEELEISYWKNGKINTVSTILVKIDADNKKIVLPERRAIYFKELLNIKRIR